MTSRSKLSWLSDLAGVAAGLPREQEPRPHYSQRGSSAHAVGEVSLIPLVRRALVAVREMQEEHFFADVLGFDCVDAVGETDSSPEDELERRVGKPHLWSAEPESWSEADLCDFLEVFHDLASRPAKRWFHQFAGCGWHPTKFSKDSGEALYRWRINRILDQSLIGLRLADSGEDVGRMTQVVSGELGALIDDMSRADAQAQAQVDHAIALFRQRDRTRETKRSAVVALAGILEQRRSLLSDELLSKDEGALFQIANKFHIRHQRADQHDDYDDEFLDWIFYWFLATVQLTDRLVASRSGHATDEAGLDRG